VSFTRRFSVEETQQLPRYTFESFYWKEEARSEALEPPAAEEGAPSWAWLR